jgi:UDP-N-acetylmuramoyl-tripeptide--D-alanyl-D-alanine ligase
VSDWRATGITCFAVEDTTRALGDIAAFNRKRFDISVAAITGSAGKTTTREMTAAVISQKFNILVSTKNFNNEIGLPLTLLRLDSKNKWAVLELGMNHPGEIARLSEICNPDIGVITNIGPVHLEGIGSIQGVMEAKGELLEHIKSSGTAVLNADDKWVRRLIQRTDRKVVLYGQAEDALIRAESIREKGPVVSFELILPTETVIVDLQTPGAFMVSNALAASTVGYLLGLSAAEIKTGLEMFQPVTGRMNIRETENGIHIINDTYNANPASTKAAIKSLTALKCNRRGALVFGDMLELGEQAESMHKAIGETAAREHIEKLYITGVFSEAVRTGAVDCGFKPENIRLGTTDDIIKDLTQWLQPGDWVLVKGSRAMGMEIIVNRLLEWGAK